MSGSTVVVDSFAEGRQSVRRRARRRRDLALRCVIGAAFVLTLAPLGSLLWTVVSHGIVALDTQFLTWSMRGVVGDGGGIYHALVGTLLVTAAATALSVPIGLLTAIYLVEYGRGRFARTIDALVDVMTGIPSIVAGLFAYAVFALLFGPGIRLGIGGAVALSVLMVPLVVRSAQEMLRLVPQDLREASYALGVPRWRTVLKVVLPTAAGGIVTGTFIAVARVIGETAPLLVICGLTDSTNFNLFHGRMTTLPVYIYSQYKTPGIPPEYGHERAWAAALVLTLVVLGLNLAARGTAHYLTHRSRS